MYEDICFKKYVLLIPSIYNSKSLWVVVLALTCLHIYVYVRATLKLLLLNHFIVLNFPQLCTNVYSVLLLYIYIFF